MAKPKPRTALRSVPPVQFRRRDDLRSLEADAAWFNLHLYSAEKGYDGRVPRDEWDAALMRKGTRRQRADALAQLLRLGQLVDDHDHLVFDWADQPPARVWEDDRQRAIWLRSKALRRDSRLCSGIKERDRDLCRYCGTPVQWGANNAKHGATYDHVNPDPDLPHKGNTYENVVVCCRQCNGRKKDRTPEAAGMPLLAAGSARNAVGPKPGRGRTPNQPSSPSDFRPDTVGPVSGSRRAEVERASDHNQGESVESAQN